MTTTRHTGRSRRSAALVTGFMVAIGGLGLATASPAAATPDECGSWASPANATNIVTVNETAMEPDAWYWKRWVQLRVGEINGQKYGWARVVGKSMEGDKYWMDVTRNGAASWVQCGPFTVAKDLDGGYTPAYRADYNNPALRFRACAQAVGEQSVCGPWW
ncbi:hypothetical protein EF912_25395 [Streptomyces sp. WAC07061]|uniref:hypothetical protein n=1 Tax=Streptomyces sp. WAC07061 TaxID=2487410 RepID=UPI000F79B130|nr:hypothetical protein [Streptomyces sp. WAC07061]RSS48314.1 hypothetical protein EF912_25395 [Streptomyces sp. WAC07061]